VEEGGGDGEEGEGALAILEGWVDGGVGDVVMIT